MDTIKAWLTSERVYSEGVKLYAQFGKNSRLLSTFLFKENAFNVEKLVYELSKIADAVVPIVEQKQVIKFNNGAKILLETPIKPPTRGLSIENIEISSFPKELEDMIVLRGYLTNKKAIIHNSMHNLEATDNEGRKAKMTEMIDIRNQIIEIDNAEYHFKKNGKMPDAPIVDEKISDLDTPLPTDPVALLKFQKSLRERKSKAIAKMKPFPEKHPNRIPLENKIAKIDAKLKDIEKQFA
jgi:hypothetical protein